MAPTWPRQVRAGAVLGVAMVVAACGGDDGSPPAPDAGPIVATFQVAGGERFRVLLTDPVDITNANRLVAGEDAPSIPNGVVVRGVTSVNEGYSWSLDPDQFEFADVTMEVCDGLPSDVEAGIITSDRYCPWSAIIASLDPAE
ncbi:MAG: hypothetical protein WEG56_02960 [Chloroflexota bacterium]